MPICPFRLVLSFFRKNVGWNYIYSEVYLRLINISENHEILFFNLDIILFLRSLASFWVLIELQTSLHLNVLKKARNVHTQ